jgi:hypothetical protein
MEKPSGTHSINRSNELMYGRSVMSERLTRGPSR